MWLHNDPPIILQHKSPSILTNIGWNVFASLVSLQLSAYAIDSLKYVLYLYFFYFLKKVVLWRNSLLFFYYFYSLWAIEIKKNIYTHIHTNGNKPRGNFNLFPKDGNLEQDKWNYNLCLHFESILMAAIDAVAFRCLFDVRLVRFGLSYFSSFFSALHFLCFYPNCVYLTILHTSYVWIVKPN